ncbi:hypothetical protein [Mesorhizobium sp. M0408]|uniref:hypothetical protein n=1 Tax=Mesorhizobium sp. M0408 TaxID=2956942 RepID=UPI00333D9110
MTVRAPVEPLIGHLKQDHRLGPNFLAFTEGDANNAMLAAVGYNLCGAMIVKLALRSFPHLLVRPVGDHLLVPTLGFERAAARSDGQGWAAGPSRSDLSLTVTSTAAGFVGSSEPLSCGGQNADDRSRGELAEPGEGRAADLYAVDPPWI